MSISELYQLFLKYPKISTDSREIEKGSIFFALKGELFNGNQYALDSLNKGAKYAVIDEAGYALDDRFILVQDSLAALQELARHHRVQLHIPIIAITGTNGKTTTKELITAVLEQKYVTGSTKGNLNNHIGVPLTLLSFSKDVEIGVIEMGANHLGEIAMLCEIAMPDFGVITNVGKAHLEGFGSFGGVKKAKSELYGYLEKQKGQVFINAANIALTGILSSFNVDKFTYGDITGADCFGQLIDCDPYVKFMFDCHEKDGLTVNTNIPGSYNFENIMASACIGTYFKIPPLLIKKAIEDYVPANNRSQIICKGDRLVLLDAYNANPSSMQAAIENFYVMKGNEKLLILGDMLELGKDSLSEHRKIVEFLQEKGFKNVFLVGDNFCSCPGNYPCYKNTDVLIDWLKENSVNFSLILIKGSRRVQLEKVVDCL